MVAGASNASFVDGKLGKIGDDAFIFPVGKAIVGYVPMGISAQPNAGNLYIAEYRRPITTSYPIDPALTGFVDHVSTVDYWTLDFSGSPTPIDLTLYWTMESSSNGSPNYISKLSSLIIARSNGTFWNSYSVAGVTTGNVIAGSITWQGVNLYGPFILGSIDFGNPLPITINYLKGVKQSNKHYLNWQLTCTNSPNTIISIERSIDGQSFTGIATIIADAVRCQQPFDYVDNDPLTGMNYYRLKITAVNGSIMYSNTIAMLNKESGFDLVSLLPNVVNSITVLNVTTAQKTKIDIVITDIAGRQVQRLVYNLIAGSNQFTLNLAQLSAGSFQITGYTSQGKSRTIRFVKQ